MSQGALHFYTGSFSNRFNGVNKSSPDNLAMCNNLLKFHHRYFCKLLKEIGALCFHVFMYAISGNYLAVRRGWGN